MKVAEYYDRLAPDYHKHYDGTSDEYPANSIRLHYILERLKYLKVKSVFEIGVGEGTPLAEIAKLGIDVYGCDVSEAMVGKARETFERHQLSPSRIFWSPMDPEIERKFDAVIATGVLPHSEDKDSLISDIYKLLKPGGSAIVEFRNSLFSLFTFNRHTVAFIMDELLAGVSERVRDEVYDHLIYKVDRDQPPKSEFDEISRFHNPFELQNTFTKHGLQTTGFLWYHAHPAPPVLEELLEKEFRKEALKLEGKNDWRGMFLCSAGLIEVKKQ